MTEELFENDADEIHYRLWERYVNEQRQLAQQLHKNSLQEIQGLNFALVALASDPGLNSAVTDELIQMRASVQRLAQQVRALQQEIFPPTLADFGLAATLRSYVKAWQQLYPTLHIQLALDENGDPLPLAVRAALFYITKQALANITQHAAAHEVQIKLSLSAEEVLLQISDDGCGFEVPQQWITIVHTGHLGLISAIKCAEAIRGQCQIRSAPGKGTTLCIVAPIAPNRKAN